MEESSHQRQDTRFWNEFHLFGGTSFPSCWNYALNKTALDNESNYHPDIALTLKRNFYVDDLLKSARMVAQL